MLIDMPSAVKEVHHPVSSVPRSNLVSNLVVRRSTHGHRIATRVNCGQTDLMQAPGSATKQGVISTKYDGM